MSEQTLDWTKKFNIKTNTEVYSSDDEPSAEEWRRKIEPWLSAIFQSEHFSLLIGSGLTSTLSDIAAVKSQGMGRLALQDAAYADKIKQVADSSSKSMARGQANLEDDLRVALELLKGYEILGMTKEHAALLNELDKEIGNFLKMILATERSFTEALKSSSQDVVDKAQEAFRYLNSLLLSFASRAASRERLNIFTTNYDRFLEYGCDEAGILLLDRFKGKLQPQFRNTRIELDYHYNPPGIRGEPRYVEGVARITKLHGSVDWNFVGRGKMQRSLLPFGAADNHPAIPSDPTASSVIYPNSAKDIETAFYPYSELFRDFSSAICRPNSSLVVFGYSFGDSHINRIIDDMLTIPSTHLVVIARSDSGKRFSNFLKTKNPDQYTLLMGKNFGNIKSLVDDYLPKSAMDRLTNKMGELLDKRKSATPLPIKAEDATGDKTKS